jgi:DNA transposition AAA+ family ATPase
MDTQKVIKHFEELEKRGMILSRNGAAKAMDINSGRLTQFLNGKYGGDVQGTAKIVEDYLKLLEERKKIIRGADIFAGNVSNSIMVMDIANLTRVQCTFGLLTGRAGLGKSFALQEYAKEHEDVIYIEADTAYSPRVLLQEIAIACKGNGVGQLNTLKNYIIDRLEGTGRLIIIDQAEYLSDRALDMLRTIHDKAKVGILLAGLPRLLNNIKGVDGIHEQIYTRIGAALELEKLQTKDIAELVHHYLPESNGIYKDFIEPCRGNARVLRILIAQSQRIAKNKGTEITPEIIARANRQLVR